MGHIGASHKQDQSEHGEHPAAEYHVVLPKREALEHRSRNAAGRGLVLTGTADGGVELRLGARLGQRRAESRGDFELAVARLLFLLRPQRVKPRTRAYPDTDQNAALKTGEELRHHARYQECLVTEQHRLANDVRVARETRLP